MSDCPHYLVFFKIKIQRKFEESIRAIFYRCYIFKTLWEGASFVLKTQTSCISLIFWLKLYLNNNSVYNNSVVCLCNYFGDCPHFLEFFKVKIQRKLKESIRPIFHSYIDFLINLFLDEFYLYKSFIREVPDVWSSPVDGLIRLLIAFPFLNCFHSKLKLKLVQIDFPLIRLSF